MQAAIGFINRIFAFTLASAIMAFLILLAVAFLALIATAQIVCPFARCTGEAQDLWGYAALSSIAGIPTILLLALMFHFRRRR
ncbi:hypothetical protein [Rhizobium multihospitium]|uniref:Uncharacterized protein n=1 Tax=Rhizobium multihospitium TaxID=410764 RepID=A0A1C3WNY1_9HYPH|nr:hypothetical protein [Rhizobium multihospitium]SCB41681.1 hypothetical protein GA0061103_5895 [Rhizobium multihospitium]